jgi:type III restriction enzyme
LTHASKQAFVAAWVTDLLRRDGFTLARANLQKFLIRNLVDPAAYIGIYQAGA